MENRGPSSRVAAPQKCKCYPYCRDPRWKTRETPARPARVLVADVKTAPHDETSGSNSTRLQTFHLRSYIAILVLLLTSSEYVINQKVYQKYFFKAGEVSANNWLYLFHVTGRAGLERGLFDYTHRSGMVPWSRGQALGRSFLVSGPTVYPTLINYVNIDFIFVHHCFFVKWRCRYCEAEQMQGTKMLRTVPGTWRQWLFPLLLEIIDEKLMDSSV